MKTKPSHNRQWIITSLLLATAACNEQSPPQPSAAPVPAPVAAPAPPSPSPGEATEPGAPKAEAAKADAPTVIGMEDPFKLMNSAGVKTLDLGWKALRKKQYFEAREAFHAVVTSYPDKTATRFQELRMAVLEGDLTAVPAMWRELLARDFLGYAHRLDEAGKELTPLRKSPVWKQIQAITAEMKPAYAAGLDQGFFFVARIHPYAGPSFVQDNGETAKLELDQEVYHFDPDSRRIRRLSNSGGQVVAIHHDSQRRQLMLLLGGTLKKPDGKLAFSKPRVAVLALEDLEWSGPVAMDTEALSVDLCFSGKGEPVWASVATEAKLSKSFTLDATGTTLVPSDAICGPDVATTSVSAMGVEHVRPETEGIALSPDGLQLTGVDDEVPVRATSAIRPGSFGWSPGKKRFVYTGKVDRCDVAIQLSKSQTPAPNALLVWDAARKRSVRVTSAVSSYETQWIDDDRLAYQSGLDRATKLTVHDFAPGGAPITVNTPAGAGLFGIPLVGCADAELHALLR